MRRWAYYWPLIIWALYCCLFFLQKISLVTSDLGRHLTNGRVISETGHVFATNYYSYTAPDFPAVNHHWLFGVVAYGAQQLVGLSGLVVLNACLLTLAIYLMLTIATRQSGRTAALVAATILLPLLTARSEVRPESISFFLLALFYYLIDTAITRRYLTLRTQTVISITLVCLQVLWTNMHLFFIFGPLVIGYFWLRSIRRGRGQSRWLFVTLMLATASTVLNPAGLRGALQPLHIFDAYGYQVAENQTIPFMIKRIGRPLFWYAGGILCLSMVATLVTAALRWRARAKRVDTAPLVDVVLLTSFAVGAWQVNRLLSFFGLMAIPVLAALLAPIASKLRARGQQLFASPVLSSLISLSLFAALIAALASGLFTPPFERLGLGLLPGVNDSAAFFKAHHLTGPIFNNYDIGGYLIYHLFPQERVFADNRPEAYPVSFFDQEYIAAQQNEAVWQQLDARYHFNVIYFFRHDATTWGQPFLLRRLDDSQWVPVFVDEYVLILVRDAALNRDVIDHYRIPRSRFGVGN